MNVVITFTWRIIIDIDECAVDNQCEEADTCSNTQGDYTCSCSSGYRLNGNLRDCDGKYNNAMEQLCYIFVILPEINSKIVLCKLVNMSISIQEFLEIPCQNLFL